MAISPARMPLKSRPARSEIDIGGSRTPHAGDVTSSIAAENDMTGKIGGCRVEVSPSQVDAGADMTLKGEVSCSLAGDLRGRLS